MDIQETIEIKRSRIYVALLLFNSIGFGFIAYDRLFFLGYRITGIIWFFCALLWFANFLWSRKIPFARITQTGLMFPTPFWSRTIQWNEIQRFYTFNKKVIFIRANGKKSRFLLRVTRERK